MGKEFEDDVDPQAGHRTVFRPA